MAKRILRLGAFAVIVFLLFAFAAVLWVSQQQAHLMITNPPERRSRPTTTPEGYGLAYEAITLTAADGVRTQAWYIPSQNGAAVILVHGYKGNRDEMLNEAALVAEYGYGAILMDLRAHGESEGEQLTFGKFEVQDVEAAYQYLLTRPDVDPERIGIIGNSLGGNVTILYAADNPQIKAVVSQSAFSSLEDEIETGVRAVGGLPPFPFAPLIQFFAEWESGMRAREIAAVDRIDEISPRPIFLMQGGRDGIVPPDSGHKLLEAAGEPTELWYEPELGHTQFDTLMAEEYERRVMAFLNEHLAGE